MYILSQRISTSILSKTSVANHDLPLFLLLLISDREEQVFDQLVFIATLPLTKFHDFLFNAASLCA